MWSPTPGSNSCTSASLPRCTICQDQTGWFTITRKDVMRYAAIRSAVSYHHYLSDLVAWNIILYQPSNHPQKGSLIYIL